MSQLKLKCQEANHICDKSQYKEASFWEKLRLTIHLLYCRACQKYTAKNKKLTKAIQDPKCASIPEKDKQVLKRQLQEELSK
jgi:SPX domain protein involved in polyphosphate accumulation